MKVKYPNQCTFKDLKGGDIFSFENSIYLKRSGTDTAVCCANGNNLKIQGSYFVVHFPNATLTLHEA